MRIVPIQAGQSPLLLLELLFKLRVGDIMTRALVTVSRQDTLRTVQHLMKANSITGVPVVENKRLFGIVSIDDILTALDLGYIHDPVEDHMTRNVVVLEDDMPLGIGIAHFEKYPFGRFPVLNKFNEVVGIVTSRNVNTSLLAELAKEINRMESQTVRTPEAGNETLAKVFHVHQYDFANAGKAANEIRKLLQERGLPAALVRRTSVALYELEINQVVHSVGGAITVVVDPQKVTITARDQGPGIPDIQLALQEGYTTANEWIRSLGFGAGMGLPNVRRAADEFEIQSTPQAGTTVKAVVYVTEAGSAR